MAVTAERYPKANDRTEQQGALCDPPRASACFTCIQPTNKALHPCAASDHHLPPWTNAHFCLFPLRFCFLLYITSLCSLAVAPRIWHHFDNRIQILAGVCAGVVISAPSICVISHEFHSYLHPLLFSPEKRTWARARAASGSVFEFPVLNHSFFRLQPRGKNGDKNSCGA